MFVHPIFELAYKWDPTLPRFYRFMFLYFRLILNMLICYFAFTNVPTFSDMSPNVGARVIISIISIILLSLLFIPLPEFLISMFRFKFYLSFESQNKQGSDND